MTKYIILPLLVLAVGANAFADGRKDYPPIALVVPGGSGSSTSPDQVIFLVIEGPFVSHEKRPVPSDEVIAYVDTALRAQGASYVGVHIREGVRYGDVVRALDALRLTSAKSISVSLAELPIGRDI
jgi:biopolymer transport protein ExbD